MRGFGVFGGFVYTLREFAIVAQIFFTGACKSANQLYICVRLNENDMKNATQLIENMPTNHYVIEAKANLDRVNNSIANCKEAHLRGVL